MGFDLIFPIFWIFIFACTVLVFIKAAAEWSHNNHSPRITVHAVVTGKRTQVHNNAHAVMGDSTGAHGYHSTAASFYYVTFQVDSGDRIELRVSGREYGRIAEGAEGSLTFQGTRYLDFGEDK